MALSRCFYTSVPLQCRMLETGECSELVLMLDFMVVHTAVCSAGMLPKVMVKTRVFAYTTDGQSSQCSCKKSERFLLSC